MTDSDSIVSRKAPNRNKENDYQYYKQRKDGWTFSVVCSRAVMSYEIGLFEIGIWGADTEIIVVDAGCDFSDVVRIEKQFDKDPEKLAKKCLKRGY